jgi:hypothetical protein
MDGELPALASSAAVTITNLLATDAWGQVREKIAGLWRRFRPEQADAIEAELTRGHVEIESADETIKLAITKDWESRLLRLLAANVTVTAELSRVLDELGTLKVGQQVRGSVRQSAKASGRSTVIQVGGDATMHDLPLIPGAHTGEGAEAPGTGS